MVYLRRDELAEQDVLQAQAAKILDDLDLLSVLGSYGDPHLVGSMAMGLMVSWDIDFNVLVDRVDAHVFEIAYLAMRPLVSHPRIFRIRYASQLGRFNPDGSMVEEGFYCGLHYRTDAGDDWKIDVWTLLPPRPEIELVARVRASFDSEMRRAALAIKRVMKTEQSFVGTAIHSHHVYEAVLHGVTDVHGFRGWLAREGLLLSAEG